MSDGMYQGAEMSGQLPMAKRDEEELRRLAEEMRRSVGTPNEVAAILNYDRLVYQLAGVGLSREPATVQHHPDCVCGRCYPQGAGFVFSKRYALKQLGACLMNLFGGP